MRGRRPRETGAGRGVVGAEFEDGSAAPEAKPVPELVAYSRFLLGFQSTVKFPRELPESASNVE